jgi:hypothetical protein
VGNVLTVGKSVSVIALTFYKAPPPEQKAWREAVEFLQQIIKDGGPPLLQDAAQRSNSKARKMCAGALPDPGLREQPAYRIRDYRGKTQSASSSRHLGPKLPSEAHLGSGGIVDAR